MSLKLGRLFGINLYVHWSFWLLPLWVAFTSGRDAEGVSLTMHLSLLAALFGCVVLHEYGHALTARLFGIATRDVTLYPIGGVARLERMSEKPLEEFCIALAGPLVNVGIAVVLAIGILLASVIQPGFVQGVAGEFLLLLLLLNVVMVGFNLVPAFPMDGGRVLRSLLATPLGFLQATRVAVRISFPVVILLMAGGEIFSRTVLGSSWLLNSPGVILIGIFVLWAGQQELLGVETRERRREEEELLTPEIMPDPQASAWHGRPGTNITVYVWDIRTHQWIAQGVIPAHPFRGGSRVA